LTHSIHSYTAKLIPHIPRYFIEKYTQKDDIILDPFCGSGTTLLEAKLLDRNAIGIDINPLAVLISEVKTKLLDIEELNLAIHSVKEEIRNSDGKVFSIEFPNIDYWFCRKAQYELSKIKFSIEKLNGRFNENIHKFLLTCLSSIIRKSSYADPRMAKTYKSKRVIEKVKRGWIPTPIQYFEDALNKNFERIKSLSKHPISNNNYVKVFQGDAKKISTILNQNGFNKVDFIITSPPYINAQDYFRSYKLELWWLGLV
jgi:16S rRNA G966 N2-methylase RsmD